MNKKWKIEFNQRNLKCLVVLFIVLLALSIPAFFWMKKTNHDRAQRRKSLLSPVVMVPGSSATIERFNSLIAMLNEDSPHPHSVLKIKVMKDGSLKYKGSINRGDNEPFIVIGFENNKDGYSNIKKQAGWLDTAFYEISQTYKFNNFKAFGHSNGGLVWTYWLEHCYSEYESEIKIKRLMTLASPFNFDEDNLNHRTQMLADFIKYKKQLPKSLKVYSLTGGQTYESDGIVPENSVAAAKYIFQNQVKSFMEITVTGKQANHSDLPQNEQVVQVMKQYLLSKNKQNAPIPKDNKKGKQREKKKIK
ncbi:MULTISPECIES: alpha/beta hydrolase [Lactobacillus]|uniref:Alpha/beta hydrolase n=1 Tax=Lactobacillus xujianguonis TaxID=2495899 RepID=A0A437SWW9_9LACO|nr:MULTISPECIES: alpha/beta hydrolase [Lactobacillus]RVU71425.1 alpha/beta hydrolase [Lactobacillus xujianguonis]RVU72388.1 alpha/beta hydrolase [Lactobacillus xujianguonis]